MINNSHDIPIIRKLSELYKIYYTYLELFPKKDKYALGAKCEQYLIAVLELLLLTGSIPKDEKKEAIRQASMKFDVLKVLLRITKDLTILETKKYLILETYLQEIGRMLGGWQRSLL